MEMNRRTFLKAGAAAAIGLALSGRALPKTEAYAEEAVSLPEDFASITDKIDARLFGLF